MSVREWQFWLWAIDAAGVEAYNRGDTRAADFYFAWADSVLDGLGKEGKLAT